MDRLILRDMLNRALNITDATYKGVGGPQTQATKLCAQWARQMATAALTIPRGEQTLSGTVWDHRLPY